MKVANTGLGAAEFASRAAWLVELKTEHFATHKGAVALVGAGRR